MISILSLFMVLTLSVLVTRIASVALIHTGLAQETARFQARSAFTGVGFTTQESEKLVNHPVRRRILLLLMLLGNAGIITAMSSLMLTFVQQDQGASLTYKIVAIAGGIAVVWTFASSRWVDRHMSRFIEKLLKRYTSLEVKDYASLLHLSGEYRVSELQIQPGDWLVDKPLLEVDLRHEGVLVLGVERTDGTFIGTPEGDTTIHEYDTMVVYGRTSALGRLDQRRRNREGDMDHQAAVNEQKDVHEQEQKKDPAGH